MYEFRLYVVDETPSSKKAVSDVTSLFEDEFEGLYSLEIVDLLENPNLAHEDSIFATPTLVKALPPPSTKIIGNFSDKEWVMLGLGLDELGEK